MQSSGMSRISYSAPITRDYIEPLFSSFYPDMDKFSLAGTSYLIFVREFGENASIPFNARSLWVWAKHSNSLHPQHQQ